MVRYGMVVDLNSCVRSRTSYVACKREHKILAHPKDDEHPYEYYRLRYVEWEWGKYPLVRRAFIPIHCMHCDDPLCVKFCPVGAIRQRSDGITVIDEESCVGCGVCTHVCPYGALYLTPEGKADGCDFCVARVEAGLPPRCVEVCSSEARFFGDLDDPKSHVAKLVASGIAKPLLLEGVKNTKVYYIPSPNEPHWDRLAIDSDFIEALIKRKRDLPPIKGIL